MKDGVIVSWLVEIGDTIARGQLIAEIENNKIVIKMGPGPGYWFDVRRGWCHRGNVGTYRNCSRTAGPEGAIAKGTMGAGGLARIVIYERVTATVARK